MVDKALEGDDDTDFPSTLPGTIIGGKYRLDGLIGRGGMGSVWSTMHLGLGQRVAVKLIAKRYASSREARQRFDLEAKAVARLRSRYVVQVFDNGETEDGTPYIVMELLEGESLDQRLERLGPMPIEHAVRILGQVARALTRAHSLGIIHRDLKPENIFLTHTEDDDGEIAKVLDFGIAKIKTPDSTDSATRTGTVLGTPLFMSPEQARGLKSVDHRTDIYSLGMVAFTMLSGRTAFSGESFGDILVAICTQPLPSLRALVPSLPPPLDGWMQRACAREPADRYQSIEQLLDGLHATAGMPRPNWQGKEPMRPMQASAPHVPVETSVSGRLTSPMTQAASGASDPRTTAAAVSVTGADIPTRSVLMPLILVGASVMVFGAVGTFVLLRKSAPAEKTATAATLEGGAQASAGALASAPAAVVSAPPAESSTAAVPPAMSSAELPPAAPKAALVAKPAARPPEPPKPIPKPPETKPSNPKPKSPDLGF